MLYFKLGLLFLSIIGYIFLINIKGGIRIEFAPAIFCAGCSVVLFFAGILNIMPLTVKIIFLLGCLSFLWCMKSFLKEPWKKYFTIILWIAVLLYFAVLLRGGHFTEYDNFSHWAMVVKNMLLTDRMPSFKDPLIMFQSYPLGSSLFIYYICKIIGTTDACYLFAQVIMLISYLLPLFLYIQHKKPLLCVGVLFSIYTLIANITIYNLLVDTLLPLAAVAAFCILAYYKDDSIKAAKAIAPLLIFLIMVKNSGIFFIIICWFYWGISSLQHLKTKSGLQPLKTFLLWDVSAPLIIQLLWKKHVALVFNSGNLAKHSMSVANYEHIVSEKTREDIIDIGIKIWQRIISWDTISSKLMVCITLILLIFIVQKLSLKQSIKSSLHFLAGIWAIFILYVFSLYAMYIFSMPLSEAIVLASFNRYMSSVLIFIIGIAVYFIAENWEAVKWIYAVPIIVLFLFPVWLYRDNLHTLYKQEDYTTTDRYRFQQITKNGNIEPGKSYFIYRSSNDLGYLYFLGEYEFWSKSVMVSYASEFDSKKKQIGNCDYLILWDKDETIEGYLEEQTGLIAVDSDGSVFKVIKE